MKLIGICGAKGSGKSEVAKYLVSHYGYTKMRFAEPLKQMLATLLRYQGVSEDIIERMLDGDLKEVPAAELEGRTPRHAMQTIGTEWRDMISPELYVNVWQRGLKGQDKVVIDDLRFLHEEKRIRELSGQIFIIKRSGIDDCAKVKSGLEPQKVHISEVEYNLIKWDFCLYNNHKSLKELYEHIDESLDL